MVDNTDISNARTYFTVTRVFRVGGDPWFEASFCGFHEVDGAVDKASGDAEELAAELRVEYPEHDVVITRTTNN